MKSQTLLIVVALLLGTSASFIGCDDNDNVNRSSQTVFTESDFVDSPSLSANPEIHTVLKFLESPNSQDQQKDTGETGTDVLPLRYARTLNHTHCWDDPVEEAAHFMVILDSEEQEILRLGANEDCVTALIEAGNYQMIITHDGLSEEAIPIFIVPEAGFLAKKEETKAEGILVRAERALSGILQKLDLGFTETSIAQDVPTLTSIMNSGMCDGCNLSGVDFTLANLTAVSFQGTSFSDAILKSVDFRGANFTNANLSGADMTGSQLNNANLTGVDLTVINLTNAILDNATWTDGSCVCGANSNGICSGCPPCPCDFSANVPMTTACWGASTMFFADSTTCRTSDDILGTQISIGPTGSATTCRMMITNNPGCVPQTPNFDINLVITQQEIPSCITDLESYTEELNSSVTDVAIIPGPTIFCPF